MKPTSKEVAMAATSPNYESQSSTCHGRNGNRVFHRAVILLAWCMISCGPGLAGDQPAVFHAQGEMAGEVTATGVILQSRLTAGEGLQAGDVPGTLGVACFEISTKADFSGARRTDWLKAEAEHDFIVRTAVSGLLPGTRYFYRLVCGANESVTRSGPTRTFRTLPGAETSAEVGFIVITGMNYDPFMTGKVNGTAPASATAEDKRLGYPALEVMRRLRPDFFVGTGDNVYYDRPVSTAAQSLPAMRRKWHEQFVLPRCVSFFGEVASFWEKDDHDTRYDDCDNTGDKAPSPELGRRVFLEQLPLADPAATKPLTYRTHRVSRDLQIWFTEGRDFRSPNKDPDGPGKSLWGRQQREWLQRTLLASDATWRVLVSPTPLVGPDDARKRDNHTNPNGFRDEGDTFFAWLKQNNVKNFIIICGDRHWQYHSIHPSGYEEFACGTLCDENARLGQKPGGKSSTDPAAEIRQPWIQKEASGGFLRVLSKAARLTLEFYDDTGKLLYRHEA